MFHSRVLFWQMFERQNSTNHVGAGFGARTTGASSLHPDGHPPALPPGASGLMAGVWKVRSWLARARQKYRLQIWARNSETTAVNQRMGLTYRPCCFAHLYLAQLPQGKRNLWGKWRKKAQERKKTSKASQYLPSSHPPKQTHKTQQCPLPRQVLPLHHRPEGTR